MTEGSSMLSAEVVIRPEFHDLDPMQIVWHGNYMRYFETARTALLALIGAACATPLMTVFPPLMLLLTPSYKGYRRPKRKHQFSSVTA